MLVADKNSKAILAGMTKNVQLETWQIEDAKRLRALFDARENPISQMEFGAKYKIGSQGMVSQYLLGRRALNIKAAVAFATGLGIKVSDFSPTLAAQIAEAAKVHEEPKLRLASDNVPSLQWVTAEEAELLSRFRAMDKVRQSRALALVRSLDSAGASESSARYDER